MSDDLEYAYVCTRHDMYGAANNIAYELRSAMTDREQELRDAVRNWESSLVPRTGSASWPAVVRLQNAIKAYDEEGT